MTAITPVASGFRTLHSYLSTCCVRHCSKRASSSQADRARLAQLTGPINARHNRKHHERRIVQRADHCSNRDCKPAITSIQFDCCTNSKAESKSLHRVDSENLGKLVPPTTSAVDPQASSEDLGLEAIRSFLKTVGVRPESLILSDGSGLSRNDMITADASVQVLTFMSKHRYADVFRDALPIAGVDGTLRNRMKGTAAENNVRAKTGTLSSASSLAGYVKTGAGERLAFAVMVNNYPSDVEPRVVCIDPIAVLFASFAGRSE